MTQKTYRNALAPGYQLHWYRVERVLGQGAFGITYLCQDVNLDRQVAVKEYLPGQLATREGDQSVHALADEHAEEFRIGLDRFIKEARTLAKFEHPNVVRVLNVFEANNTAYMAMTYEEGETLREVLARRKTLPEADLRAIAMPLLDGLEHIHAAGFIHRDIKPANIFIRTDGTPVLIDFGAARQAIQGHTLTLTNFVSKGYAAIEQYSGKSDKQGPWTDIYGLAATLYRAMTGIPPADAVERSEAISHGDADILTSPAGIAAGGCSEPFLKAIDHALAFRADKRPQTIAAWRGEFETVAAPASADVPDRSEDTGSRYDATTEVIAKPAASSGLFRRSTVDSLIRRPVVIAAALLGVAILAAGWYSLTSSSRPAPESAEVATAPPAPASAAAPAATAAPTEPATPPKAETPAPAAQQPAAANPETLTPEQDHAAKIDALLAGAREDITALRLTSPRDKNAFDKYLQVLALDGENAEAKRGITAIADKYVELVYRDLQANRPDSAENYLNKAAELAPNAPSVLEARDALAAKKNPKPAAATTESGPAESFQDKVDQFKQRFDTFMKEQAKNKPAPTRAEEFRKRIGGGQ